MRFELAHNNQWPLSPRQLKDLLRLARFARPMKQTSFHHRVLDSLVDKNCVYFGEGGRVLLTEDGENTIAAHSCRSTNHGRRLCWGTVRSCPLCATAVCHEDGAADDIDDVFPGICDNCAFGVTLGNAL